MTIDSILVERTIYQMLKQLPFYGALLQTFKISMRHSLPTACVRFDDNGKSILLIVNPDYFKSLSDSERIALLWHECSHVDRLHLIRLKGYEDRKRGSIAADLAINCFIPGLPEGGVYPKNYRLRNFMSMEWYYKRVVQKGSAAGPGGEQAGGQPGGEEFTVREVDAPTTDVHDWHSSTLSLDEQAAVVENSLKRALEKIGNGAGSVPQHVQESLSALKEMRTKNWHKELRKFLGRTVNGWDLERTWSRRNRRYGLQEAGTKTGGGKKLCVAFDTSASMSQIELQKALAETRAMIKKGVVGHLVLFDTKVNEVMKLTRNNELAIHNRGGTCFQDLMAKVDALHCDGLVVFTDGDDRDVCEQPKTPVLWVYTNGMRSKYNWGYKTLID